MLLLSDESPCTTPLMNDTLSPVQMNKQSTVMPCGLTAMEFTALSDSVAAGETFPVKALMYIRSRTGLGLADSKKLVAGVLSGVR